MFTLIIHATNVHQGGGGALLSALLGACPSDQQVVVLLDKRMTLPTKLPENLTTKLVSSTIWQRLRAEWWLAKNAQPQDTILCFGNLPPLFKLRGHVVVFVQNRYLIDGVKLDGFPLKVRLRLAMERLWLFRKMSNVSEFIVQTPTMKKLLDIKARGKVPIRILPFVAEPNGYARNTVQSEVQKENICDFVYVASGEPHKNHRQLIEAWCLLAKEGLFPSLKLTLDMENFAELCSWLGKKIELSRMNVENVGCLPHAQVKALYDQADALIFPSTFESFGLPLIEARQAGLPVLASELDYVRDALDPEQTFDPESAVSIARAVKRFLGINEQPLPLLDATQFMASISRKAE